MGGDNMDLEQVGKWAFLIGLGICLITGFFPVPMAALVLFGLGLIVGFLKIGTKKTEHFLIATIVLLVLGVASIEALSILGTSISSAINTILASFIAFVGASALVVAVKIIIEKGK